MKDTPFECLSERKRQNASIKELSYNSMLLWRNVGIWHVIFLWCLISSRELTLKVLSRSVWDRWYTCV